MATPALNQNNYMLSNLLISITHSQHHHAPVCFLELKYFCTTVMFTWFYMHREKCTKFVMILLFLLFICNSSRVTEMREALQASWRSSSSLVFAYEKAKCPSLMFCLIKGANRRKLFQGRTASSGTQFEHKPVGNGWLTTYVSGKQQPFATMVQ